MIQPWYPFVVTHLAPEFAAIMLRIAQRISYWSALHAIEAAGLLHDTAVHTNRSVGQSRRQAIARARRHMEDFEHG